MTQYRKGDIIGFWKPAAPKVGLVGRVVSVGADGVKCVTEDGQRHCVRFPHIMRRTPALQPGTQGKLADAAFRAGVNVHWRERFGLERNSPGVTSEQREILQAIVAQGTPLDLAKILSQATTQEAQEIIDFYSEPINEKYGVQPDMTDEGLGNVMEKAMPADERRTIKQPGSRGGQYYRTDKGDVRYGKRTPRRQKKRPALEAAQQLGFNFDAPTPSWQTPPAQPKPGVVIPGEHVTFTVPGSKGDMTGRVLSVGADGATIMDVHGQTHKVLIADIKGRAQLMEPQVAAFDEAGQMVNDDAADKKKKQAQEQAASAGGPDGLPEGYEYDPSMSMEVVLDKNKTHVGKTFFLFDHDERMALLNGEPTYKVLMDQTRKEQAQKPKPRERHPGHIADVGQYELARIGPDEIFETKYGSNSSGEKARFVLLDHENNGVADERSNTLSELLNYLDFNHARKLTKDNDWNQVVLATGNFGFEIRLDQKQGGFELWGNGECYDRLKTRAQLRRFLDIVRTDRGMNLELSPKFEMFLDPDADPGPPPASRKVDGAASETAKNIRNLVGQNEKPGRGNAFMASLIDEQGIDGPPQVCSEKEMDRYVIGGEMELFRGTTVERSEQIRTGKPYLQLGVHGSAYYFAYGQDAGLSEATAYTIHGSDKKGCVIRATLRADANVVEERELLGRLKRFNEQVAQQLNEAAGRGEHDEYDRLMDMKNLFWRDIGAFALYLGYDAIDSRDNKYMMVLNRTMIRIQQQDLDPKNNKLMGGMES